MNRDRAKELLPIIEAFANGEDVEVKRDNGSWMIDENMEFCGPGYYRIKPRPREFWLCWNNDEICDSFRFEICGGEYADNEKIVDHWDNYIKVREVL